MLKVSVQSAEVGDRGRLRHITHMVKVDLHAFT